MVLGRPLQGTLKKLALPVAKKTGSPVCLFWVFVVCFLALGLGGNGCCCSVCLLLGSVEMRLFLFLCVCARIEKQVSFARNANEMGDVRFLRDISRARKTQTQVKTQTQIASTPQKAPPEPGICDLFGGIEHCRLAMRRSFHFGGKYASLFTFWEAAPPFFALVCVRFRKPKRAPPAQALTRPRPRTARPQRQGRRERCRPTAALGTPAAATGRLAAPLFAVLKGIQQENNHS